MYRLKTRVSDEFSFSTTCFRLSYHH